MQFILQTGGGAVDGGKSHSLTCCRHLILHIYKVDRVPCLGGAATAQQQTEVRTPRRLGSADTGSQQRAPCGGGSEGSGRHWWGWQRR